MSTSSDAPLRETKGKVAFITGGSSGIGLGIARACALSGMKVVITYRTEQHLAEARACLEKEAAVFHAIMLDVGDGEAMARAADEAESLFGGIDLLCNNAGVGVSAPIREATTGDWA